MGPFLIGKKHWTTKVPCEGNPPLPAIQCSGCRTIRRSMFGMLQKKINKKEPRVHPTNPELHTSTYRKKNLLQCFLLKKKNSIEAWFQRSLASPAFISNLDKQGYSRFLKLIVVVGETRRPVWEVRSHEAYRREKETEDTHSH